MEDTLGCCFVVRYGTLEDPPEYCDAEALPGEELCAAHVGEAE